MAQEAVQDFLGFALVDFHNTWSMRRLCGIRTNDLQGGRLIPIQGVSRHCLRCGFRGAAAEGEGGALGTFVARKAAHLRPALSSRYSAAAKRHGFARGLVHQAQVVLHATRYQFQVSQCRPLLKNADALKHPQIPLARAKNFDYLSSSLDRRRGATNPGQLTQLAGKTSEEEPAVPTV